MDGDRPSARVGLVTAFCGGPVYYLPAARKGTVLGIRERGEHPQRSGNSGTKGSRLFLGSSQHPSHNCSGAPEGVLPGEPCKVPGATARAPSVLTKPHSWADRCFWSVSGKRSVSTGTPHCRAVAAQPDTQQSSPMKASTTQSHKQSAQGTPHPKVTEMSLGGAGGGGGDSI